MAFLYYIKSVGTRHLARRNVFLSNYYAPELPHRLQSWSLEGWKPVNWNQNTFSAQKLRSSLALGFARQTFQPATIANSAPKSCCHGV